MLRENRLQDKALGTFKTRAKNYSENEPQLGPSLRGLSKPLTLQINPQITWRRATSHGSTGIRSDVQTATLRLCGVHFNAACKRPKTKLNIWCIISI